MASKKKSSKAKQPAKKQAPEKILITSALPYVNNVPHLGNIIGCVLSADVFARFCRSTGKETLFICGTDEHGTATETKALEEGLTPKQICDKYYTIHKKIYEWFGCSFDCFGRTSTDTHTKLTQDIFLKLHKKKYITTNDVEQLFCITCKKFLADRFIEGSCPHCNYPRARGDQCESCGKLLNATELKNPACKICRAKPIIQTSTHLFLNLAKLQPKLAAWVKKQSTEGFWPSNAATVTNAWLGEGLKERCITRDLTWGVPVPLKGFEKKVFYVWFDAPIGYPSITAHEFAKQKKPSNEWKKWWQAKDAKDVKLYQFMAKDNIPFHTILFPASLIGTGDDWNLLFHINSTEYLNYEDGKFSKSAGSGVFGDDAISTGISPDVWRYYLLVNRPETQDTQFNWNDFQEKNNHELLANLGNFVNRTLVFLEKNYGGVVPDAKLADNDQKFINHVDGEIGTLAKLLQQVKLKDGLRHFMLISKHCNQYFQENEPWTLLKKGEKTRCGTVLNVCVNAARVLAVIVQPFLPFTAREILRQLNVPEEFEWGTALKQSIPASHKINTPRPLFRKLEESEIQGFRERFKGKGKSKKEATEPDPFSFLELRVAKIVEVRKHPNADKLYIEQIDLGPRKTQIVSGLAEHYTPEQLLGKNVIVVANLAPAKLRGEMSHGMLLAGTKENKEAGGKTVKILEAPKNAMPGDGVGIEGIESNPKRELSIDEFFKAAMSVKDKRVWYRNRKLKTKTGDITIELDSGMVG